MKCSKIGIAIIVALFTGCASLGTFFDDPNAKLRWPVNLVPWANVLSRIDSAEVVILCLVDSYKPNKFTVAKSGGPKLFGSRGYDPDEITPAQMLERYLWGVRSLAEKDMLTPSGESDPKKMSIFIVECGEQTRERAGELFTQLGTRYYDNTIPVIYVFHNKQMVTSYTYTRNPGQSSTNKLRTVVGDLFKMK